MNSSRPQRRASPDSGVRGSVCPAIFLLRDADSGDVGQDSGQQHLLCLEQQVSRNLNTLTGASLGLAYSLRLGPSAGGASFPLPAGSFP